jgi:hypothetical protein
MTIGSVIRRQREALNLSQSSLAAAVGVDTRQIRRYEAGDTQPAEILNPHQVNIEQHGDTAEIAATTRGTQSLEEGGYLWRGELRLWDNEILTGWYIATEGAVRSKGSVYFVLHPHGIYMSGRWVGLSYDGPIVSGWGTLARTEDEALAVMAHLKEKGQPPQ